MTPYDRNRQLTNLDRDLFRRLQGHPFRDFIIARSFQKALEDNRPEITEYDVLEALEEFRTDEEQATSWATFFYTLGGALLGIGGCSWIALYFTTSLSQLQLFPFIVLAIIGLLIMFAGVDQE